MGQGRAAIGFSLTALWWRSARKNEQCRWIARLARAMHADQLACQPHATIFAATFSYAQARCRA